MTVDKRFIRNVHNILRNGNFINILADALINEFTVYENNITDLKKSIQLSTATGTYLEDIGQLFGIQRKEGETDSSLRLRIQAGWYVFSTSGTKDQIKQLLSNLLGINKEDVTIEEFDTLKYSVNFSVDTLEDVSNTIRELLNNLKPAGVYNFAQISTGLSDDVYYSDSYTIEDSNIMVSGNFTWDEGVWQ